jgi:hypothetical protein
MTYLVLILTIAAGLLVVGSLLRDAFGKRGANRDDYWGHGARRASASG